MLTLILFITIYITCKGGFNFGRVSNERVKYTFYLNQLSDIGGDRNE